MATVIGCLTALYDTAALGRVEMPPFARRQDYGLWLTLLQRTPEALSQPEVLADYRVRKGSLSSNRLAAARATWAILREHEGLPRPVAGYYFLHYAWGALAKRAGDRDCSPATAVEGKALPFRIGASNPEIRKALRAARRGEVAKFGSVGALFDDLNDARD